MHALQRSIVLPARENSTSPVYLTYSFDEEQVYVPPPEYCTFKRESAYMTVVAPPVRRFYYNAPLERINRQSGMSV